MQGLSLGGSVVSVWGKMAIEEMALKHVKKAREHDQCFTKVTPEDLINRDTKTLTDAVLSLADAIAAYGEHEFEVMGGATTKRAESGLQYVCVST